MINPIVISSRIRLARNFHDLPFPNKLSDFESATSVSKAIFAILGDYYEFRRLKHMDSNACLMLLENHTISKELIDSKDISGYALSPDGLVTIMINEEDHLRLQCILDEFDLKKCYDKLNIIDEKILDKIDMAYSSELGFLTSCPSNVGTGMRASVMLFLPALSFNGVMKQLIETLSQNGLVVRGLFGEDSACDGYFYQISNSSSLGYSEDEIIDMVSEFIYNVCQLENQERQNLLNSNQEKLKDDIFRSYGILTNAFSLKEDEMIELLSQVKLGQVLGFIDIKNDDKYQKLYHEGMSANLQEIFEFKKKKKENIIRAEYISKEVKILTQRR